MPNEESVYCLSARYFNSLTRREQAGHLDLTQRSGLGRTASGWPLWPPPKLTPVELEPWICDQPSGTRSLKHAVAVGRSKHNVRGGRGARKRLLVVCRDGRMSLMVAKLILCGTGKSPGTEDDFDMARSKARAVRRASATRVARDMLSYESPDSDQDTSKYDRRTTRADPKFADSVLTTPARVKNARAARAARAAEAAQAKEVAQAAELVLATEPVSTALFAEPDSAVDTAMAELAVAMGQSAEHFDVWSLMNLDDLECCESLEQDDQIPKAS